MVNADENRDKNNSANPAREVLDVMLEDTQTDAGNMRVTAFTLSEETSPRADTSPPTTQIVVFQGPPDQILSSTPLSPCREISHSLLHESQEKGSGCDNPPLPLEPSLPKQRNVDSLLWVADPSRAAAVDSYTAQPLGTAAPLPLPTKQSIPWLPGIQRTPLVPTPLLAANTMFPPEDFPPLGRGRTNARLWS